MRKRNNNNNNNKVDFLKIANEIIAKLKDKYKISAYIYHVSCNNSVYVRFDNPSLCSIRLSDHEGRSQYRYKFNLRSDFLRKKWEKIDEIWRFYVPIWGVDVLCEEINKRNEVSKEWSNKYNYSNSI